MTTAFVYAAVCIFIAGLLAVIVERTGERDQARRDLKSANAEADLLAKTVRESAAQIVELEIAAGVMHQIPPLRLFKGGAE